jgi:RNA polymerase sigma-70 factor (ECF subfamily)
LESSRYETTHSEESDWVVQAVAGHDGAFRCLVERHEGPVYRIALRILKDPDWAAEAAQDAFIKAHRGLPRFESRSKFSTWLYRITHNVVYDWMRKRKLETVGELDDSLLDGERIAAGAIRHRWRHCADSDRRVGFVAREVGFGRYGQNGRPGRRSIRTGWSGAISDHSGRSLAREFTCRSQ